MSARTRRTRQPATVLPVPRVRVDLGSGYVEHRLGCMQRDVDRSEVGQRMRANVTPGRGGPQRPGDRSCAAVPARGHPGAAVREARPAGVAAGNAERLGRDIGETDVEGVAGGHASGRPGVRDGPQVAGADREQPVAVGSPRGHQRVGARTRAGAVLLGALQPPAAVRPMSRQPGARGLRGPHSPPAPGRRRRGAEFGQDGQGVGMTFGQPGQGEIFPGQVREDRPALTRTPAAGQRQIQPAGFDRGRERRGDGSIWR